MNALKLLAIDTSGKVASAAVTDGGLLLAEKSVYTKLTHSQIILPMAKELLADCELSFGDLDGIVCAKGPGSYTGLRIGIAAVKGIVMGCPTLKCAGISTLEALAAGCAAYRGRIVPIMKARNGIVYCGVYESDGERVICTQSDRVCSESEAAAFAGESALLTGDGCEEIKQKYFSDCGDIKCAPSINRLQKASSLCAAFEMNPSAAVSADELSASYLQETKAEKDKAHGGTRGEKV
jgi:tRNA threonylcarbamoyladenosine biosynthesis protein TsaB